MSVPSDSPIDAATSDKVTTVLAERLAALLDLQLTLKHVHWNVTGPNFIAVHEMLDPQADGVRAMSDTVAERIATLGATPLGTPGSITSARTWDDYSIGMAPSEQHLREMVDVYDGVIGSHRQAIAAVADLDPITEDILIGQTAELEQFRWFLNAHLKG